MVKLVVWGVVWDSSRVRLRIRIESLSEGDPRNPPTHPKPPLVNAKKKKGNETSTYITCSMVK